MDRRPRDIPPEDRYGGGQSYRPGIARNRTPPRNDGYGGRSPPRRPYDARGPARPRSRSPNRDTFRRRTPSPNRVQRADTYRVRPRSPFRRDLARDDLFSKDVRDERAGAYPGRSPARFRDRSPAGTRPTSPYRRRTPPGPRRDIRSPRRFDDRHTPPRRPSPRREFSARPRSPRAGSDWQRTRSPSPRFRRDLDDRSRDSATTSRRSSPPVHASRLNLVQDLDAPASGRPSPRGNDNSRQRSPIRDGDGDHAMHEAPELIREQDKPPARPPPSGPSADRAPPTGPAARAFVPPAGPRGDIASRGGFASRGRGGYNPEYAGRSSITATFNTVRPITLERSATADRETNVQPSTSVYSTQPVTRPIVQRTVSRHDTYEALQESRPVVADVRRPSIIPSGPALDRRETRVEEEIHSALRNLPEIIPNGKKIAPVVDHSRYEKLDEDAERLRKVVLGKDTIRRKALRDWNILVRECDLAAERSEIAETSVRGFENEGERAGAAF